MASGRFCTETGIPSESVVPAPEDEYDSDIGGRLRILASSGSEEVVVRFLGARLLQIAKDIGLTVNDLLKNR